MSVPAVIALLAGLALMFAVGFEAGKRHGCDRVGGTLGVFRTDSHVYRVCR